MAPAPSPRDRRRRSSGLPTPTGLSQAAGCSTHLSLVHEAVDAVSGVEGGCSFAGAKSAAAARAATRNTLAQIFQPAKDTGTNPRIQGESTSPAPAARLTTFSFLIATIPCEQDGHDGCRHPRPAPARPTGHPAPRSGSRPRCVPHVPGQSSLATPLAGAYQLLRKNWQIKVLVGTKSRRMRFFCIETACHAFHPPTCQQAPVRHSGQRRLRRDEWRSRRDRILRTNSASQDQTADSTGWRFCVILRQTRRGAHAHAYFQSHSHQAVAL
jgi:hypothetical protein